MITLEQLKDTATRRDALHRYLDIDNKKIQVEEEELRTHVPDFWQHPKEAQAQMKKIKSLQAWVNGYHEVEVAVDELQSGWDFLKEGLLEEAELDQMYARTVELIEGLELRNMLRREEDHMGVVLKINSGAGGTESQDWASMLMRMYMRWAERRGYKAEIEDIQPGEEAGVSRATFRVIGPNAYGYCKAERGVHRLVRISPFDANKRRHTSFASVDVIAEIEDDIDMDIKDEELKIDTYRSSGKGGQHVNKTESAVRITHLPTGIVVACQNERSQFKNKASAMKILKSRIYEKLLDQKRAEMDRFYGEKGEISWGNQIRSYVFQPYQLVKDLRTGAETGNLQAVMDGDLDMFVNAWLRAGMPTARNKNYAADTEE